MRCRPSIGVPSAWLMIPPASSEKITMCIRGGSQNQDWRCTHSMKKERSPSHGRDNGINETYPKQQDQEVYPKLFRDSLSRDHLYHKTEYESYQSVGNIHSKISGLTSLRKSHHYVSFTWIIRIKSVSYRSRFIKLANLEQATTYEKYQE